MNNQIEELQKEIEELDQTVQNLIEERDRYKEALEDIRCTVEEGLK